MPRSLLLLILSMIAVQPVSGADLPEPGKTGNKLHEGPELVLYYFTSSHCAICRNKAVVEAVREARRLIAETAAREGKVFTFVGVSGDYDIRSGVELLEEVAPLDQIAVGRGVFNDVNIAVRLHGNGVSGRCRLAYPTLLVADRTLDTDGSRFGTSTLWTRYCVSGGEIVVWVRDGALLPLFMPGDG